MLTDTLKKLHKKKYLSRADIVVLTNSILERYGDEMGWKNASQFRIDLREIYESVLYPEFEYQLIEDMDLGEYQDEKILGKVINKDKVILIDRSVSKTSLRNRYPFTLGHEFGHSVLHKNVHTLFRCTQSDIFEPFADQILERQANMFAENLIMPDWLVRYRFNLCFKPSHPIRYIGAGEYWLNPFGVDISYKISSYTDLCKVIAYHLRQRFSNISKESLGLKIGNLGLVKNETKEEYQIGIVYEKKSFSMREIFINLG